MPDSNASGVHEKPASIAIVGASGKIGSWLWETLEPEGIELLDCGRTTGHPLEDALLSDCVFLSNPPDSMGDVLGRIFAKNPGGKVFVSLHSLQKPALDLLEARCGKENGFFGMHPLFMPKNISLEGQSIIFCDSEQKRFSPYFFSLFSSKGFRCHSFTRQEHDSLMAFEHGLNHFDSIAFAKTFALNGSFPSTNNFRIKTELLGRIFAQNPELYFETIFDNPESAKWTESFCRNAEELTGILKKKDKEAFKKYFEDAKKRFSEMGF